MLCKSPVPNLYTNQKGSAEYTIKFHLHLNSKYGVHCDVIYET